MTVQMTAAQARKLGIDLSDAKPAKVRTTRRTAKGDHYHTVCKAVVESTAQCSAEGGLMTLQQVGDAPEAVAALPQVLRGLDVDAPVLTGVDRWRQDLQVLRAVVGLVPVPVVDVLMAFGTGDDAMLVGADVLGRCAPDQLDVAAFEEVALGLAGGQGLARPQGAPREPLSIETSSIAPVASAALARRTRYDDAAVDADNFPHTVIIRRLCATEFQTIASEDRHVKETGHARYELVLGYSTKGTTP